MQNTIELKEVKKSYGSTAVLKGISFTVSGGEVFALLGTNGAGKTTTLECIEGLRSYDFGKIKVNGSIGVQLQSTSLLANIKVKEAIELFSRWNNAAIPGKIIESLSLSALANTEYGKLSTGQKRRLHLALAVAGDPDIIILDEPTAGLDVEGRAAMHAEIRSLRGRGKSVLLASHDMAEVESLCDRIAILHKGHIVFHGTPRELTSRGVSTRRTHLRTSPALEVTPLDHSEYLGMEQEYAVFEATDLGECLAELLRLAKEQHLAVLDIQIEQITLEERFLQLQEAD